MAGAALAARLRALLPKLEDGRDTHVQWRDCPQEWRDQNPDIGDRAFHTELVAEYDERIACVNEAIAYIESNP